MSKKSLSAPTIALALMILALAAGAFEAVQVKNPFTSR